MARSRSGKLGTRVLVAVALSHALGSDLRGVKCIGGMISSSDNSIAVMAREIASLELWRSLKKFSPNLAVFRNHLCPLQTVQSY